MGGAAWILWLALLAPAPPQGGARRVERAPEPYPYLLDAVDALWGHLIEGRFSEPLSIFYERSAGELYVVDGKQALVGIYDAEGTPLFAFGREPLLLEPRQVGVAPDGTIFVLDALDSRVHAFSYRGEPRGTLEFAYPAIGEVPGGSAQVTSFTLDAQGRFYVAAREPPQVLCYEADLTFRFAIRNARAGAWFVSISGVAVSDDGLIAVTDLAGTPVQVFDAQGRFVSGFGKRDIGLENFTAPVACGFDREGFLFVVDMLRHEVKIFESSGAFSGFFGGWSGPQTAGRSPGEMRYPTSIAFGPEGRVWVSERFGQRVQVFRQRPREEQPQDRRRAPRGGG